uniref:Secreted protein n=1 Tax=Globodera rostochiensis TaxID=31243 RepID=A0A914HR02_GLORO
MGCVVSVLIFAAGFAHGFFSGRSSRALPSSQDILFPPISYVLVLNGRPDLIDSMENGVKYKNEKAIESIGRQLRDLGLDHITDAFVTGVKQDMFCSKCNRKIEHIDELCYCSSSRSECHHGTGCCNNRKIKALTSGR